MTTTQKTRIKRQVVSLLRKEKEIRKIIVFGSFPKSRNPHDIDIAVFQDSGESYLPLALKYRKKVRDISRKIPVDIIPLIANRDDDSFMMKEILNGETVYERRN